VYTQCSKCETVFRLSADVLRAAGGQVRCGKCGEVFNALAHLAEDASVFATGETALDLETRADSILESISKVQPPRNTANQAEDFAPAGVEIARLQILDWNGDELANIRGLGMADSADASAAEIADSQDESAEDPFAGTSMEFTLPPGELDRIFVESKTGKRPPRPPSSPSPPPPRAPIVDLEPPQARTPIAPPQRPQVNVAKIADAPAHPEEIAMQSATNRSAVPSGFEVPEDIRSEMLLGLEPEVAPLLAQRQLFAPGFTLWLSAAVASALLLIGQIVHQNREWLTAHAPFGRLIGALYSKLGAPVPPPANLSAYQLRQWGVTGDPAADGTLRVRASILNTAAQLEPYPLLRVTLANRFGASMGARDFEPAEYMGKPVARLLAPGERVDATMNILDPGKSAEGFEIDVCLRAADKKVSCANDAAPAQTKR
jgi:predicted Zn finger-like uncharacterized protein